MNQPTLFEKYREPLLQPRDRNTRPQDAPRLTGQNAAILERLKRGPATNQELVDYSLKYTSRISDLRAKGYRISCERGEGGLNTYTLETRNGAGI